MEIPKKLKIGGHWLTVKYPYIFQERFDRYAQFDDSKKTIYLTSKDGNGEQRAESGIIVSLIHEILHGLDINIGHKIFAGDEGENKIEGLSEAIYAFLIDNGYLKVK